MTEASHHKIESNQIGIYIHIPYCKTLCPYCDFVKTRTRGQVPEDFVEALLQEIANYEGPNSAGSIFFGGGTPSLLAPRDLDRILGALHGKFSLRNPEITLEANPDDLDLMLVKAWRDLQVNRISLGVQSFDDGVLRYLGRRHDSKSALDACHLVAAHFENWSLDLIFGARSGLHRDDAKMIQAWKTSLSLVKELAPPHCSAYGLTYEQGTPFAKRKDDAVDEDTYLLLYEAAEEFLSDYDHYEISNYALKNYQARHNLVYWHNGVYAGFGTGAYSFLNAVRARNKVDLAAYLAAPGTKEEAITISEHEMKVETLIQYFRLREGLPRSHYRQRFGCDVEHDFTQQFKELYARGLLEHTPTHINPTALGFKLNNEIALALL